MGREAERRICLGEEEGQAKMLQKPLSHSAEEKAVAEEAVTLLPDQQAGGT